MHRNIHLLLRINGLFAIMDSAVIHSQVLMTSVIFPLKVLQGVEHEVIISTIRIIIGYLIMLEFDFMNKIKRVSPKTGVLLKSVGKFQ